MEANIFDPDYVKKSQAASLQRMAAEQNALRVQRYKQACADWITTNLHGRDLGLPITDLPAVPRKIAVDDEGDWVEAAFADIQAPVLPPPVAPQTDNPFGKLNPTGQSDFNRQLILGLGVLNDKLDRLLARGV